MLWDGHYGNDENKIKNYFFCFLLVPPFPFSTSFWPFLPACWREPTFRWPESRSRCSSPFSNLQHCFQIFPPKVLGFVPSVSRFRSPSVLTRAGTGSRGTTEEPLVVGSVKKLKLLYHYCYFWYFIAEPIPTSTFKPSLNTQYFVGICNYCLQWKLHIVIIWLMWSNWVLFTKSQLIIKRFIIIRF